MVYLAQPFKTKWDPHSNLEPYVSELDSGVLFYHIPYLTHTLAPPPIVFTSGVTSHYSR